MENSGIENLFVLPLYVYSDPWCTQVNVVSIKYPTNNEAYHTKLRNSIFFVDN